MARTAQPECHQPTRRQFVYCVPAILGGSAISSACSEDTSAEGYEAVAQQTWRLGSLDGWEGPSLSKELVRYATLAPSSHNTQCWKFAIIAKAITILPDISRQTPAVDRDDHHLLIGAATIEMAGTINMSASAEQWKPFTSRQGVVTAVAGSRPGFLWNAQVNMFPGVPARVEDSYMAGEGQLIAKLLGLFTVAHARGGGELARGEFMRYFAEAAWYPTALLPSQGVRWQAVDDASANASIVDGPIALTLLFRFNDAGLIAAVRAESRGSGVGKDMVMLPWDCGLSDYQPQDGMLIPMIGEAAWARPDGRKAYFVGKVKKLSYQFVP